MNVVRTRFVLVFCEDSESENNRSTVHYVKFDFSMNQSKNFDASSLKKKENK